MGQSCRGAEHQWGPRASGARLGRGGAAERARAARKGGPRLSAARDDEMRCSREAALQDKDGGRRTGDTSSVIRFAHDTFPSRGRLTLCFTSPQVEGWRFVLLPRGGGRRGALDYCGRRRNAPHPSRRILRRATFPTEGEGKIKFLPRVCRGKNTLRRAPRALSPTKRDDSPAR